MLYVILKKIQLL